MTSTNPIWRTYQLIVISTIIVVLGISYIIWLNVKSNAEQDLTYSNTIMHSAVQSTLNKNEALLKILGLRLVELGALEKATPKALELVNDLLRGNPELAGVGLANPQGQLVLTSFNVDRSRLPNLLTNPESAKSFKQTLNSNTMVVGRTYFMKALDQWVIPVRYRIQNANGEIVAVMTTGFKLNSAKNLWSTTSLPPHIQAVILRSDYFGQYVSSSIAKTFDDVYAQPINAQEIEKLEVEIKQQLGLTLETIRNSNQIFSLQLEYGEQKNTVLTAIHYDPHYQHYTVLLTPLSHLYNKMMTPLSVLILMAFLFSAAFYWLFRSNDRLQKRTKASLEYQANHDFLTGLPNRRYLLKNFQEWQRQFESGFYVLFIDLNNFKISNDLYGHSIGDEILKQVSERLIKYFGDQSMVVRQGGDEFIVLMPQAFCKDVFNSCQSFLQKLKAPLYIDELMFSVGASIGVVHSPDDGVQVDELLRKADMSMYEAKQSEDNVYIFSHQLEKKQQRRAFIESELANAIKNKELYMVYQPQIDAKTLEVVGVEALIRWEHPVLNMVSPDEFIPIAENSGLIQEIGQFVLETSMHEFAEVCISSGQQEKLRLSINISVRQLFNSQFLDNMKRLCHRYECEHISLAIEVTENLFIEDIEHAKFILEQIQLTGIEVSLDDFGTGYSSLSVLNQLPINELKIDKSFVRDILTDEHDKNLIHQIINLSKSFNIPVLAEGVEESQQAQILNEYGCDLFQGYYFSKPLKVDELQMYLKHKHAD